MLKFIFKRLNVYLQDQVFRILLTKMFFIKVKESQILTNVTNQFYIIHCRMKLAAFSLTISQNTKTHGCSYILHSGW